MSSSLHRPPEDRPGLHEENGHATVPRPSEDGTGAQPGGGKILGADLPKVEPTEQPVNNTPSKTPAPVAKTTEAASKTPAPVTQTTDPASKTQKTKGTGAQRFVSLSKQGLAKAVGAAGGKTGASKAAPDEPKETSELRVVYPRDPASAPPPRVDIIAVHDIDETLQRAWIYRKKTTKRRANDSRAPFAAGGINSHDGTAGSPAPRHGSRRQPPPGARKKTFDDANNNSIEKWLAGAARPSSAGEPVPPDQTISEAPPDDHGPSNPIFAPVEEHEHHLSILGMLTPVPEEDISEQKPRFRRRPTLHNDRRRAAAGHVANIAEEERVSSVGGSRRHNAEVLSDRRSSLDQSGERRINWLSDPDMLPSEIPGVRVMCYTYKSPKKVPSPHQYLNELGKDLARRLAEMRPQKDAHYNKVPIIFVGLGFGCLILQRVITLLDFEYCRSPTAHPLLAAIAGVIFLDAPAPIAQFPSSRSQETNQAWTQDWLMTKNDSKIDTSSLWRAFWVATMSDVELTWYYSPTGANAQKVFIDVPMAWCRFIPTQSTTAHRLSRFEGPNDIDYRSIVEAAKRIIITKCCIAGFGPLAGCLADFMRDGFPIDLPDHRGFTPLHLAIRNWNLDAVKRLTHQGNASVFKKDNGGRSPLHTAVLAAGNIDQHRHVYEGEEIDPRKIITQITNVLLKKGARVDDKDMFGKTPWSYVKPKNEWIKRLKYKHLIIGSSSTTSRGMESVRPPLPGPQQDACNAFDMILAEVYVLRKAGRSDEAFNFEVAPVFDAIYKASSGVSRLLDEARLPQLASHRLRCRWLHVPSNNEQWVYDLMLSLGIQDNSMGRQRHEGSQLIDRYMMPQARRYKYFHGKPVSPQADPGKRVNRMATTDIAQAIIVGPDGDPDQPQGKPGFKPGKMSPTPAPTMTEADGIVIFMPILGFETHRQRKFLAQSFRDIDHAMQKRRALGEDDSPWPVAQFANPVSEPSREDNQDEAAERSDGMSSVGEQSIQANPGFEFITRARRHIKTDREAKLLRGYLDSKQVKPVHCRRTLDQFLYYMLDSTEARDKTQVAYRWAKNSGGETEQQERRIEAKDRPIVMVDQLWLWALHDGTVITSCPSTWAGHEEYNLNDVIVKELKRNKDRRIIQSAEELLHLILKTSLDFFRRKGPAGFQFHECFQSSINKVSEKQGKLFNAFRQTTEKLHVGTLGPEERKREIEVLFSLEKETELLVEIMDIQDELTIVKTILGQQHDVLEKLLRLYPKRVEEDADEASKSNLSGGGMANSELVLLQNLVQLLRDQAVPPTPGGRQAPVLKTPVVANALQTIGGSTAQETIPAAKEGQRRGGQALKGGQKQAEEPKPPVPVKANVLQDRDLMYETLGIVENNLRIVTDMLDYAAKVESSIENLLDLKQKHANGWEARFAREGSEESQRQGNIILVFTLVTVVFLPLSFFASFFALDLDIFPRDPVTGEKSWPIGEVSGYLFGLSGVVFIPLILLALYVNKLISGLKTLYKRLLQVITEPQAVLDDNRDLKWVSHDEHDSDDERTYIDGYTARHDDGPYSQPAFLAAGGTRRTHGSLTANNISDAEPQYALLFGRFAFHTRIPGLRLLWQQRLYRLRNPRYGGNRWKDTYVADYPLNWAVGKVLRWGFKVLVAVLACLGSERHRKIWVKDRGWRRRRRFHRTRGLVGEEGDSAEWSTSDGYDEGEDGEGSGGDREGVERRDFGLGLGMVMGKGGGKRGRQKETRRVSMGSGYWKPGSGVNRDGSQVGAWSNQTRSRVSFVGVEEEVGEEGYVGEEEGYGGEEEGGAVEEEVEVAPPGGKEARKSKLNWLRMRRRKKQQAVDEEKNAGVAQGGVMEQRGEW